MTHGMAHGNTTAWIQDRLDRIAGGDPSAAVRDELLRLAETRIRTLVSAAVRAAPGLARWEQDEDVLQEVLLRLDRAVQDARPRTAGAFFTIVSQHIRWATVSLLRRHMGPMAFAANHQTQGGEVDALASGPDAGERPDQTAMGRAELLRLHEAVDELEPALREAWYLHTYVGLTLEEAATHLGVSSRTVHRRVREARLRLTTLIVEHGE